MYFQIDKKAEGRVTYRLHKIFRDVNKNIFNFRIQLFIRINLPSIEWCISTQQMYFSLFTKVSNQYYLLTISYFSIGPSIAGAKL
jgi:hypothetical protein